MSDWALPLLHYLTGFQIFKPLYVPFAPVFRMFMIASDIDALFSNVRLNDPGVCMKA